MHGRNSATLYLRIHSRWAISGIGCIHWMKLPRNEVLSATHNQVDLARLIVVAAPHSGAFLQAIPMSMIGTRLDETSFRIAVAIRLGAPVCTSHQCICGAPIEGTGLHGLSCRKSSSRIARHSAINGLIKTALSAAEVPSRPRATRFGSWRQQKTRWSFDNAMVRRSMLGLELHLPRHSGSKSYQPCHSWSRNCCIRRRNTEVSQVRPTAYLVAFCSNCDWDFRCFWRRSGQIHVGTRSTTN